MTEHFRGKNLLINFAIAFIPAIFLTTILLELEFPETLASTLPIVSLVYAVGVIRKNVAHKKNTNP